MASQTRSLESHLGAPLTSWLPVTTPWPAFPDCLSAFYSLGTDWRGGDFTATAFDPWYGKYIRTDLTCLPDAATTWLNQRPASVMPTYLSLGPLVCPEQYTTATTSPLDSMSTLVACYPSNYEFNPAFIKSPTPFANFGECVSKLSIGQVISYQARNFTAQESTARTSITTITKAGARISALPINGYVFNLPTVSTGSQPSSTSTPPSGTTNTSAITLSTGAKAGIGVGVAVIVLALASLVVFILYKRRSRRRQAAGIFSGAVDPHQLGSDTKATHMGFMQRKDHRYELGPGDPPVGEVSLRPEFRHELGN